MPHGCQTRMLLKLSKMASAFASMQAPDLPGGIDRSRDWTPDQSMVKGHDQRATVVAEDSPHPHLLSKICQAFSPVKRYNYG